MYVDTDWCLACNRRVEGNNPYCSPGCHGAAGPSNLNHSQEELVSSHDDQPDLPEEYEEEEYLDDYYDDDDDDEGFYTHNVEAVSKNNWAGRGSAGILAWAADIPLGAHPDLPYYTAPSPDDASSISSASSTNSTYRAPNLVRPSRPLPPSLTMTKPELSLVASPRPILTIQKQLASNPLSQSPGSTTRTSIFSEDSLPTPASAHAMPFSTILGRPFPSISDARAHELAACTKPSPSYSAAPYKDDDDDKYIIRSRGKPVPPRIFSPSRSSLDDDLNSSPPWWATNSMVARHATKAATKKPFVAASERTSEWHQR